MSDQDQLLTVSEVAELLQVDPQPAGAGSNKVYLRLLVCLMQDLGSRIASSVRLLRRYLINHLQK